MNLTIAEALNKLDIILTHDNTNAFILQVSSWELKGTHSLALNSQMIGIHTIVFTTTDRDSLFTIFNVDQKKIKSLLQKCSAIDQRFIVTRDNFNILSIWLIHLGFRDIQDPKHRAEFQMAVAKYLHYKFFTSLTNYYFSYKAVEKFMAAAINNLSRKFDIVVYGTWKRTIEARCADLISTSSIHRQVLEKADDDIGILRTIQDCQTRIRDKIKNVTEAYYKARETGSTIGSRSATVESEEHGKILVQTAKTLDVMVYNLMNELTTERLFIDRDTVKQLVPQFGSITDDMFINTLRALVGMAETQRDSSQLDLVKTNDGRELYIGLRVLISNLIQKTYRYCMSNEVDLTNKAAIYIKAKNIFSSSRISDEGILAVKQSVSYIVDTMNISRRETTKSSLRLGILLYIIIRSFRFL